MGYLVLLGKTISSPWDKEHFLSMALLQQNPPCGCFWAVLCFWLGVESQTDGGNAGGRNISSGGLLLVWSSIDPSCQFCLAFLMLSTGLLFDLGGRWEVGLLGCLLLLVGNQDQSNFSAGWGVVRKFVLCFLFLFFSNPRIPNQYAFIYTPVRACLLLSVAPGSWVNVAERSSREMNLCQVVCIRSLYYLFWAYILCQTLGWDFCLFPKLHGIYNFEGNKYN